MQANEAEARGDCDGECRVERSMKSVVVWSNDFPV